MSGSGRDALHHSINESNAAERERLRQLVARLTDDDCERDLEAGWTVGSALVHVAFWDMAFRVIRCSPNDALLPQWRLVPSRAAVQELLAAMDEMDRKVEGLPPDLVSEVVARKLANLDRGEHRRGHRVEIERILSRESHRDSIRSSAPG